MNDAHAAGELVQVACVWEALARKVGNVHRGADFAGTTLADFLLSAAAIAPWMDAARPDRVGATVLAAVRATRRLVGQNTNLGIVLALAPLCAVPRREPLRAGLSGVLAALTVEDAKLAYEAIRLARPGGLGDAMQQDVRGEPTVTLREAMALAADRDPIARQYANGFADAFDFGTRAFLDAFARFGCVEAAVVDSQLHWLAAYPDGLISRKNGPAAAEAVRGRAAEVLRLGGIATPEGRLAGVALDGLLRSDGNEFNPGTTADLVAACLYIALRENEVAPSAPFRWDAPDWLAP